MLFVLLKADGTHDFIGLNTFVLFAALILCIVLDLLIKKYDIRWLPESVAAMVLGVIVGGLATLFGSVEAAALSFNPELFFFGLLPVRLCFVGEFLTGLLDFNVLVCLVAFLLHF